MIAKTLNARIVPHMTRLSAPSSRPCDVFINHRGIDTKRTIAGLLFQHLSRLGLKPFLDSKSLRPGDGLFEKIDPAIQNCQVGLAVFSQRYCESYFCLHELALMRESKKKVVPVFCDVKPSELQIKDNRLCSTKELERFHRALEEAKNIVGLTFDTINGLVTLPAPFHHGIASWFENFGTFVILFSHGIHMFYFLIKNIGNLWSWFFYLFIMRLGYPY